MIPRWFSPFLPVFLAIHVASGAPPTETHLLVNAIIGRDGESAVQCWSINPPFNISQQAGTVGAKIQSLGDAEDITVVFFNATADVDSGPHRAPSPQWGLVLQGSGVVTFPATDDTVFLPQGAILLATDTADVSKTGHESKWTKGTIFVQVPFKNQVLPGHTVIIPSGPCPAIDPLPPRR